MPTLARPSRGKGGAPPNGFARVLTPTGSGDDVQFQAAINNLGTKGGTILFLEGGMKFNQTVTIDRDDVTIMGASKHFAIYNGHGWNGTTPVMTNGVGGAWIEVQGDFAAFTIAETTPDSDGRHRNINFINFGMRGNVTTPPASYVGIGINGGGNDDRCHFIGLTGYHLKKCLNIWMDTALIDDCNFQDNLNDAITITAGTKPQITNSLIWDNGGKAANIGSGVDGAVISGNALYSGADVGVYLNGATTASVTGNNFGPCTTAMVETNGGSGHSIVGNTGTGNANTTNGVLLGVTSGTHDCIVNSNSFVNASSVAGYAVNFALDSSGVALGNDISGGGWNAGGAATIYWTDACTVANNRGDFSSSSLPTVASGVLKGWYKAGSFSAIDGATLSAAWANSGGGQPSLAAVGSPVFHTSRVNASGQPAVTFGGSADAFRNATWGSFSQPFTMFTVFMATNVAGAFDPFQTSAGFFVQTNLKFFGGSSAVGAAVSANVWYVGHCVANGASSTIGVNNALSTGLSVGANGTAGVMAIGVNQGGASEWWPGDVAECIFFTGAMTAADCSTIARYLGQKYGITVA